MEKSEAYSQMVQGKLITSNSSQINRCTDLAANMEVKIGHTVNSLQKNKHRRPATRGGSILAQKVQSLLRMRLEDIVQSSSTFIFLSQLMHFQLKNNFISYESLNQQLSTCSGFYQKKLPSFFSFGIPIFGKLQQCR